VPRCCAIGSPADVPLAADRPDHRADMLTVRTVGEEVRVVAMANPLVLVRPAGIAPLAGYSVAIASDRRRARLADLMERNGARSVSVQAVRAYTTADEIALRAATEAVVAEPIDELVIASSFGLTVWLRAATRWGMRDDLVERFRGARLLAASARAADGLRDHGFAEIWSTAAGTTEELARYLISQGEPGRRIAMQCDGPDSTELCHRLRTAGIEVVAVPTYQCAPPTHADILRRLAEQIELRQIDAVVFTSPEAVDHLLAQARVDGRLDAVLNAMADDLPAICRTELGAASLHALGLRPTIATAPFADETVEAVANAVARRAVRTRVNGYRMEVRGQAVVMNDQLVAIQPGPIGVLRALARHPGQVMSCADIRRETPGWTQVDDHAIEMAVSRLRRSLGRADLIQTVMRRGYRLAV
jgi:uroporphyrinogen-III synthase